MTDKKIIEKVAKAISQLQIENSPLQIGASERSFAHRLAVHMEKYFDGWNIDCEYNRQGDIPKKLEGVQECNTERTTDLIYPDIIVHYRTNDNAPKDGENLLVVEMKHCTPEDPCDKRKLELFTDPKEEYRYQLGLYINMTQNGKFNKTWYKNGVMVS